MITELFIRLPRPVTALHQIEMTSHCSLRCPYCPSKDIVSGKYENRPALDMTLEHFEACIEHVAYFVHSRRSQDELNLAGIGESMMLPHFVEWTERARRALPKTRLLLATNGLHLTEEIAVELKRLKVELWISLHRPEKAGQAVAIARKHDILSGVSVDPSINSDDWAGQVQWMQGYHKPIACEWIRSGWAMAMADGRVTTCCLDAQGLGVVGHVLDEPGKWHVKPYKLCGSCQQEIAVRGHEQRPN